MTLIPNNISAFCMEMQTLDIRVIEKESGTLAISFEHYDPAGSYTRWINKLSEFALTEILSLPEQQVLYHLNRLKSLLSKQGHFIQYYYKEGREDLKQVSFEELIETFDVLFLDIIFDEKYILDTDITFKADDFGNPLLMLMGHRLNALISLLTSINEFTGLAFDINSDDFTISSHPPTCIKQISYLWTDKSDELLNLYERLSKTFIIETSQSDFLAAFSGKIIGSFTPIKWHDSNATELLYFLRSMMPSLIADERTRMNYQKLTGCFVKPDGSKFDIKNLKSLNQRVEIDLSHIKKRSVDDLISQFL